MNEIALKAAPVAPGPPVEIDANWVRLQRDGYLWREFEVRLPSSAGIADLNENPVLWRRVQGSAQALKRFDRLTVISYGEEWLVDAVVSEATGSGVTLAGIRKIELPARREFLFQDDMYRVVWMGNGYAVERKKDKLLVSPVLASAALAERALARRYSTQAA